MMTRHFKKMTDREFKQLKSLLDAGVSRSTLVKTMARSYFTVAEVTKAKTFEEYRKNVRAFVGRYVNKHTNTTSTNGTAEHKTTTASTGPRAVDLLQDIKDLLVAQSKTLHALEELWEYPADYFKRQNMKATA